MTTNELKQAVAERFAKDGIWIDVGQTITALTDLAIKHTGIKRNCRESMVEYLRKFSGVKLTYSEAKWVPPFRPLRTKVHPRMADIDAAQPPFMTPKGGIGNGSENSLVWRR